MEERPQWAVLRSPADLGLFLARLRAGRGWTQADAAAHFGVPRRYLHELEHAKEILAYTRLFELAGLLGARITIEAASQADLEADPWHA
ncbi:MAG: helix-turn-helix domain-containing protein [Bifidobacteriaceae bacterium]|jgi:transcriptional regulator with XRE-family HTH domain|nr:helix-turn-helix domain-containing protein [Bifidobacteriaceae bacterium]